MRTLALSLAVLVAAVAFRQPLAAQTQTLVVPPGHATNDANTAGTFPFARGRFAFRCQHAYDSSAFVSQGIVGAITITALRWRADGGSLAHAGRYAAITIELSTSVWDHLALGASFEDNHGADRRVVHHGAVAVTTTDGGNPNTWSVEVPLSTPFTWNPAAGDLLIDVRGPANAFEGSLLPQLDVAWGAGTPGSAVTNLASATQPTGSFQANVAPVVELRFVPGVHDANVQPFGSGCYDRTVSFYQLYGGNTFDLAGRALRAVQNGSGGYVLASVPYAWHAPISAPLSLGGDGFAPVQMLPWTIHGPGFSTDRLWLSAKGRVWFSVERDSYFAPSANALRFAGPSLAVLWSDFQFGVGGALTAELEPVSGSFIVTWTDALQLAVPGNRSSFQVAFDPSGDFEMRWASVQCSAPILVGMSEGRGAADPGPTMLAALGTLDLGRSAASVRLLADGLPSSGTVLPLRAERLPPGTAAGVLLLGFAAVPGGTALDAVGMPACRLFHSLDASLPLLPAGPVLGGSLAFPPGAALHGAHVFLQAVTLSPGLNAAGLVTSNALDLRIGS
jgi:hypothetical protein